MTLVAAALFAAACDGDGLTDTEREASGIYALTAINGLPLPFTVGRPCGESAEEGYLELGEENRFFVTLRIANPVCPEETDDWTGTGIWTVLDGNVRLVSDLGSQQFVLFGAAPATFTGTDVRAAGTLEVVGYEGDPVRPTLRPVQVTFTFTQ